MCQEEVAVHCPPCEYPAPRPPVTDSGVPAADPRRAPAVQNSACAGLRTPDPNFIGLLFLEDQYPTASTAIHFINLYYLVGNSSYFGFLFRF